MKGRGAPEHVRNLFGEPTKVPWRAGPARLAAVPSWLAPRNVEAPPAAAPSVRPPEPRVARPDEASSISLPPAAHIPDVVALPPPPALDPTVSESIHASTVAENAELKAALAGALAQLASVRRDLLRELEPGILRLAIAIGEKVAGAAIDADSTPAQAWVQAGVDALEGDSPLVVAVAPTFADSLATLSARVPDVRIEIDPTLPRWGCVVRGDRSRVDVGLSKRVAAIAEALGVESTAPADGSSRPAKEA